MSEQIKAYQKGYKDGLKRAGFKEKCELTDKDICKKLVKGEEE